MRAVDGERAAQLARPVGAAFERRHRLERANQHRRRRIARLAHDVEAVVHAVDQKDVGVAGRAVERLVALGPAEARVAGQILLVHVGLDLDDAPGALAVHEVQPEQLGRDLEARAREERARQARHQTFGVVGGRARHVGEEQPLLIDALEHRLHAPVGGERSNSPCATRR